MQQQRLRGLIVAAGLSLGCAERDASIDPLARYLDDAAYRRAALEDSLVAPSSPYARLRLDRYERDGARGWRDLDEWNPPAAPARLDGSARGDPSPLESARDVRERDALARLGERAFWVYPAQLASSALDQAVRDGEDLSRFGFISHDGGWLGVLRVRLPDGSLGVALSCAACHVGRDRGGRLSVGLANASLDLGALAARALSDPAAAEPLRLWGPGRVDVSSADGSEPVAIPDLRPARHQRYLHRAGAVVHRSLATLAVRIETLLITSLHEAVRPPREVAAGLALFIDELADALPTPARDEGARVFATRCARCHGGEGRSGGLVPVAEVGTDARIAWSVERGTGAYRVPSLRGVGARRLLLHDGSIADIDGLLDPRRERGGHRFGHDLSDHDRAALARHLLAL